MLVEKITVRAAREALLHAEDLIRGGWTQGAYCRTRAGSACDTDADDIRRVDLSYALDAGCRCYGYPIEQLREYVLSLLDEPYRSDPWGLEHWNDQQWRSRTEVLLLLRRAREGLRG